MNMSQMPAPSEDFSYKDFCLMLSYDSEVTFKQQLMILSNWQAKKLLKKALQILMNILSKIHN